MKPGAIDPSFVDLSAILLAGGSSRRSAPVNKLLLPVRDGVSVVRATTGAFVGLGFGEIIVVTGHESERVAAALEGLPVRFVFAPDHTLGMGHSLAAGIRAARSSACGFAVAPADLPGLTGGVVSPVATAFLDHGGRRHVVPVAAGRRGHPVVIGGWLRAGLEALTGDEGARVLLRAPAQQALITWLEVNDPAIWRDVDAGRPDLEGREAK